MDAIGKYMRGYVRIRLETLEPERFFSLCVHNEIPLYHLVQKDSYYEMDLSVRDFFRLNRFRRKTNAHIHIVKKTGMPFFLLFMKKRKAFFLGILICILLIYLCSLRIWEIQCHGNSYYTTPTLLDTLNQWEIRSGMSKNQIDCQKLMQQIRQQFPQIVWVSARIEGTCLIIDIKENEELLTQDSTQSSSKLHSSEPCWNLSAAWDGKIISIITRSGTPLVKAGDICKKGDLLVSGRLEILDNDNQVQRYEYVKADADILMEIQFPYYDECKRKTSIHSYSNQQKNYPFINLFGTELSWFRLPKDQAEIYRIEKRLALTSSFFLPITVGKIVTIPYETQTYHYTDQELLQIASDHLQVFLENLVSEEAAILSKNIQTTLSANRCCSRGYVTIQKYGAKPSILTSEPLEPSNSSKTE